METRRSSKSGFTLVELLVVITIITILAALLIPAVYFAIQKAKEGRIAIELANIEKALERYKIEYGEYPPDFAELALVAATDRGELANTIINNHMSRIFRQRYAAPSLMLIVATSDFDLPRNSNGQILLGPAQETLLAQLGPHNALQFWLRGFSPDPARPLFGGGERQPFFEFDKKRSSTSAPSAFNSDGGESPFLVQYIPQGGPDPAPYLYYRANPNSSFATAARNFMATTYSLPPARSEAHSAYLDAAVWANANSATRPYFSYTPPPPQQNTIVENRRLFLVLDNSMPGVTYPPTFRPYAEPKKFQLITAGLDSMYGVGGNPAREDPPQHIGNASTNVYDPADKMNMTNFSGGKTLEDLEE